MTKSLFAGAQRFRVAFSQLVDARPGAAFAVLLAAWIPVTVLLIWRPTVEYAIDPKLVQPVSGHAYIATLVGRVPRGYRLLGDDLQQSDRSDLQLFWNSVPLSPPHAVHADIAAKGGGAYSHWINHLYFSAPDGSDPRTGRDRVTVRASVALKPGFALILGAGTAALAALTLALLVRPPLSTRIGIIWSRTRIPVEVLAWFDGTRGCIVVAVVLLALVASGMRTNWDQYAITPDSASYIGSQFSQPALRPPIVSTWIGLFSDRLAVQQHITSLEARRDVNKLLRGDQDDPILPVIRSQRVLLCLAFVALAFVSAMRMSVPGVVIGFGAAAIEAPGADWIALGALALGALAIAPVLNKNGGWRAWAVKTDRGLIVEMLLRALAVAAALLLFFEPVLRYSYLSDQQQFLMSETLAMSMQLLFVASALVFIWSRNRVALIAAGIFAGLCFLTRSAAVFAPLFLLVLVILALVENWRRWSWPSLVAVASCGLLVFIVPITWALRFGTPAPAAPMLHWGPVAFAIEVASPQDVSFMSDDQTKAFLAKAISERDRPVPSREANPPYRASNLGSNLYYVAHPVAAEILKAPTANEVDQLFGKVARPVLMHRAPEYAAVVLDSIGVATALHPTASTTRVFGSVWHWIALVALLSLAFFGRLRDTTTGLIAAMLVSMHLIHIGIVAAFDMPIARYVYATELFVVIAIVFLVDSHVRAVVHEMTSWRHGAAVPTPVARRIEKRMIANRPTRNSGG